MLCYKSLIRMALSAYSMGYSVLLSSFLPVQLLMSVPFLAEPNTTPEIFTRILVVVCLGSKYPKTKLAHEPLSQKPQSSGDP